MVNCIDNDSERTCESSEICVTKLVWQRINESITSAVDGMKLSELVEQSKMINPQGKLIITKANC